MIREGLDEWWSRFGGNPTLDDRPSCHSALPRQDARGQGLAPDRARAGRDRRESFRGARQRGAGQALGPPVVARGGRHRRKTARKEERWDKRADVRSSGKVW